MFIMIFITVSVLLLYCIMHLIREKKFILRANEHIQTTAQKFADEVSIFISLFSSYYLLWYGMSDCKLLIEEFNLDLFLIFVVVV